MLHEQTTQNVQDLDWSVEHRDLATLCIENDEQVVILDPKTLRNNLEVAIFVKLLFLIVSKIKQQCNFGIKSNCSRYRKCVIVLVSFAISVFDLLFCYISFASFR